MRTLIPFGVAAAATFASLGNPQSEDSPRLAPAFAHNAGQHPEPILFTTRLPGVSVVFERDAVRHRLRDEVVVARFVGSDPETRVTGEDPLPHRTHYYLGADPTEWHESVLNFAAVRYCGLYPGVDAVFRGTGTSIKYDFELGPRANATSIAVRYDGARSMGIEADGSLIVRTETNTIVEAPPYSYQVRDGLEVPVDVRFELRAPCEFGFRIVGAYDRDVPVVIDPSLAYSTYLGSASYDQLGDMVVDYNDQAYVVGASLSPDFPATGSPVPAFPDYSVFVSKFDPNGSSLLFSVFLGGSSNQIGYGIDLDPNGDVYICGDTTSTDFPTTVGAYDTTFNSVNAWDNDAFVARLDGSDGTLEYSTYVGGASADNAFQVKADDFGSVYVAGETWSHDFPTTSGAYDSTLAGPKDVTLIRLHALGNGSADLDYSTYLGGDGYDEVRGLDPWVSDGVFLSGSTAAPDFPATHGATGGGFDAFVAMINPSGGFSADLLWAHRLGGSGHDYATRIDVTDDGEPVFVGITKSSDFPTTAGSWLTTFQGGGEDAFAARVSPDGSTLDYCTYLGGSDDDRGMDVVALPNGNAIAFGFTKSPDMATTTGAYDTTHNGGDDFFVTTLNVTGSAPVYSTFFGGGSNDVAYAFERSSSGAWFLAGTTQSADYPTTTSSFDTTINGGPIDAVVSKLIWPQVSTFGNAIPNSVGSLPLISLPSLPWIGNDDVSVLGSHLLPGTVAHIVVGTESAAPLPLDLVGGPPGSALLVDPFATVPLITSADGNASLGLSIPYDPGMIGLRFSFQILQVDPGLLGIYGLPITHSAGATMEISP